MAFFGIGKARKDQEERAKPAPKAAETAPENPAPSPAPARQIPAAPEKKAPEPDRQLAAKALEDAFAKRAAEICGFQIPASGNFDAAKNRHETAGRETRKAVDDARKAVEKILAEKFFWRTQAGIPAEKFAPLERAGERLALWERIEIAKGSVNAVLANPDPERAAPKRMALLGAADYFPGVPSAIFDPLIAPKAQARAERPSSAPAAAFGVPALA